MLPHFTRNVNEAVALCTPRPLCVFYAKKRSARFFSLSDTP